MSLAEELAEKYCYMHGCVTAEWSIADAADFVAAINEAIERCAQEAFNTPLLTGEFADLLRNRIGKRIRALKEQP